MLSILFIIGKKPGIGQKALAETLILDQSTMSRDLKRLTEEELILSNRGSDSRQSELSLTVQGYDLVEEISPVWEALHHKVEALLGQFNVHQIDMLSEAIRTNLDDLKM